MPDSTTPTVHFLAEAPPGPEAEAMFGNDVKELGYVMNLTHLWAHQPAAFTSLFDLLGTAAAGGDLSLRQKGILVGAAASSINDSYCSLAWGSRLAGVAGNAAAAGVLLGDDTELDPSEAVMARWARKVALDPTATTPADVQELREAGLDDAQIFAMTLYVALRVTFSTVNNALGVRPDSALADAAPPAVRHAVTYGRPVADM
ncbi:MAG: carboxymuconolactone decarboxylase family protein [Acidimicrobiia bacterium]